MILKRSNAVPTLLSIIFILSYYLWPLETSPKAVFYVCFGLIIPSIVFLHIKHFPACKIIISTALAFVLYTLFSTLWVDSLPPLQNFIYHSKRAIEISALILIIAYYFDAKYHRQIFIGVVLFASVHALILIPNNNLSVRLTNPIDTGMVYGIAAVIALYFALQEKKTFHSVLFFFALTIMLIILLITKSRGPQLALVITSIVLLFIQRKHINKAIRYALVTTPITIGVALSTDIFSKLFSRGFSVNQRDIIWKETLLRGNENFWFGLGMQKKILLPLPNGHSYTHSHNFILDTFRLTGFVGFCLIIIVYLYALYKGFESDIKLYQLWALILLFGGLCLMTNGSIPFNRPSHSWIAFWIPIAMICTQPQLSNKQGPL